MPLASRWAGCYPWSMAKKVESRADVVDALAEIVGDKSREPAPRIQAARTLMDLKGWKKGDQSKSWETTPQDELEAAARIFIPQYLGAYVTVVD